MKKPFQCDSCDTCFVQSGINGDDDTNCKTKTQVNAVWINGFKVQSNIMNLLFDLKDEELSLLNVT